MTKTDKRVEELERRLAVMEKVFSGVESALFGLTGTVKSLVDSDAKQQRQVEKLLDIVERAMVDRAMATGVPDGSTVQ